MNELIKITKSIINNEKTNSVNARELHEFLEVNTQFKDWIIRRIEDYGFVEGQEYIIVKTAMNAPLKNEQCSESDFKGPLKKDYYISLDMAKELSMVERNEKGKQARKYFIECENKLKEVKNNLDLDKNPVAYVEELIKVSQKFLESEKERQRLEGENRELNLVCDDFLSAKNSFTIREVAKQLPNCGQQRLFDFLRDKRYLMKNNEPYQEYIDNGLFTVKTNSIPMGTNADGTDKIVNKIQPLLTSKGAKRIASEWENNFSLTINPS